MFVCIYLPAPVSLATLIPIHPPIKPRGISKASYSSGRIKDKREYIWNLLDMRVGGMDQEDDELGGYLVLMRCDNLASSCRWSGDVIEIEPTADCTITLSRIVRGKLAKGNKTKKRPTKLPVLLQV
ncbi:hypothetical protein E2C01_084201 [Portunus trituberculatus]|uniref:Uncharacterized protein n=1 Tax=Portunus trituberculatus TaxID=210409 RepID=A0A5B7J465_PORTR|nr:hypothetical protein [Portunus trituberculatus]